ncbi:MAG TPA: retropepsin-like aspartic protease [Longimicrobiales bacterium]
MKHPSWCDLLLAVSAILVACRLEAPPTAGRAAAPADTAAGEVPLRLVGPNDAALVVPVHIDGTGPYDFVFDTGSTLTCIDPELAGRLGLEEQPVGPGVGIGAGGAERLSVVAVDSIRIGRAVVTDVLACVIDLEIARRFGLDVHGLVGLNFMKPFRITIDFGRGVIRIVRADRAADG